MAIYGEFSHEKWWFNGGLMGKPWENHRKTIGKWWFNMGFTGILAGLVNSHFANWKDPPLLMGKSTISMVIFNSKLLNYQRVCLRIKKSEADTNAGESTEH